MMTGLDMLAQVPRALVEYTNLILTTPDATIGSTPKDVVWTHRNTTLYRYRSADRSHPIPILLVFALINRPDVFDLRPGNSFVEHLLAQGFDVFLVDWGVPGDADDDMGLAEFVCDELHWAVRETRRSSGSAEISMVGWCIGGALTTMYCALHPGESVRNAVLLTTPIDPSSSLYATWVGGDHFDVDLIVDRMGNIPGPGIDWANKMMKPVTNFVTTYRRVFEGALQGRDQRVAYQAMAKWVVDNPPFPAKAFRQWITWMYKENRLVSGRLSLRDKVVDLHRIQANLLVVTADADHIAPPCGTTPLLDMVSSTDVTYMDRRGGHIGLMAGSKAKREVWPEISSWLAERSD